MNTLSGRLPRSLVPHPEESLRGYLLNLSHRIQAPPHTLLQHLGLGTRHEVINQQHALVLNHVQTQRFAEATGLAKSQVVDLTYLRYAGQLFDETYRDRDARSFYGGLWIPKVPTNLYCPRCLDTYTDPYGVERVLWKTRWLAPWTFACVEHDTMLVAGCPNEDAHRPHHRGRVGLLTMPRRDIHPGACRESRDESRSRVSDNPPCGTALTTTPTLPLTPHLRATQQRLDLIIDGEQGPLTSHDEPVTPPTYLTDLRTLAVIISIDGGETYPLVNVNDTYLNATQEFAAERRELLTQASRLSNKDFVWSRPIADLRVASTVYATGLQLLDEPDAGEILRDLGHRLREVKQSMWFRLRTSVRQSGQVGAGLRVRRDALLGDDTARLTRAGMHLHITPDYVPAVVPGADLSQFFESVDAQLHFHVARIAPVIAVKMLTEASTQSALETLGYKYHHLDAVTALNEAFTTPESKRAFLQACRGWVQQLNDAPVNYGHRRRYFTNDWLLNDKDWKALQRTLLRANRATQAVLSRRHRHYSVWVWSLATSSYAKYAPMIESPEYRASDPDHGAMGFMNKVKHSKRGDDHVALVQEFAARIAARIDKTAPPLTEANSPPLVTVS